MSIILKGINLPKYSCIPIKVYYDGSIEILRPDDSWERIKDSAIQTPKGHGRLIDASELDKCWEEKEDISEDVDFKILYKCVLAISKYAPTILEAEENDMEMMKGR